LFTGFLGFIPRIASGAIATTWYARDAQGNQLASYKEQDETTLRLMEQNIYCSSRLGIANRNQQMYPRTLNQNLINFAIGRKRYELTNHLGNVLATISDVKGAVDVGNDGTIDYFKAAVKTQQDYYPFGMVMPERN